MSTESTSGKAQRPRVHIYSDRDAPAPNTNGAGLAVCSQVQAFLDLGFEVEFVLVRTRDHHPSEPSGYFQQLRCTFLDATREKPPRYAQWAYWVGWPRRLALWQIYAARELLLREAKIRIQSDPTAFHVFNFLRTANVIPDFPTGRAIWACHEIESDFLARNFAIDQESTQRPPHGWERRLLRRVSALEREVARCSGLVLCVAAEEAQRMREQWSVPQAAYLPISIALGETTAVATGVRGEDLRLLHMGDVSHLPSYSSLEFLLTRVFPLLDAETLARLQLEVVGRRAAGEARADAILEMARPYAQVQFSGILPDIRAAYRRNDLQVVASTRATGVRTRIIESWAVGMPVLCTTVAAGGVKDLAPGRNILIADDPLAFANALRELVHQPERLEQIAEAGRQTYEAGYSRPAVASVLRELLNAHFGLELPPIAVVETSLVKPSESLL